MSVVRRGFLYQTLNKQNDNYTSDWIIANLEISGRPSKLSLIADPIDPIYESVDGEDHKIRFRVNSFRKCIKVTQKKTENGVDVSCYAKSEPRYQIILQRRKILKGKDLRIGFNDKDSRRLFLFHIKEALNENKRINSNALYRCRRMRPYQNRTPHASCDINEIDRFLTENKVYEKHGWSAVKVLILPTDLAARLQLRGIYLLEIRDSDMCLLDYITMSAINRWPFKYIRSFGFNEDHLYVLTGSQCIGGRGLLVFESEKCADLMSRMICMMRSIAGESDTSTEKTISPSHSVDHSKRIQLASLSTMQSESIFQESSSTPTKKSIQDLSASLQDFCRTHCCSLPPLRGRNEACNSEAPADSEVEIRGSQVNNLEAENGNMDENLSLCEMNLESTKGKLEDVDVLNRGSNNDESKPLSENELSSVEIKGAKKDNRKRALRTSSLKKSISDFISHSLARIESVKPVPPIDPLKSANIDESQNAPKLTPPSASITTNYKSQSLVDSHITEESYDENDLSKEQRCSRRMESAKAVQLIKWRDLPEKEDYYVLTPNRYLAEMPEQVGELCPRSPEGFNFTSGRHSVESLREESLSMQEETSLPDTSTSTARDLQLSAVLTSDMIAFTSF